MKLANLIYIPLIIIILCCILMITCHACLHVNVTHHTDNAYYVDYID